MGWGLALGLGLAMGLPTRVIDAVFFAAFGLHAFEDGVEAPY
jgi:hypothetical protein